MKVRLLHFASFREAAGRDQEMRELAAGTRVEELWRALGRELPFFARFASVPPAAVNRQYVDPGVVLREGDEVVFLPPVAGG